MPIVTVEITANVEQEQLHPDDRKLPYSVLIDLNEDVNPDFFASAALDIISENLPIKRPDDFTMVVSSNGEVVEEITDHETGKLAHWGDIVEEHHSWT